MNKDIIFIIVYIVVLILISIISYLANSRSKAYKVTIFDFKTNKKTFLIVKARTKSKTYEVVSKFLAKNQIEGVIIEVFNIAYINNNTILNL